MKTTHHLLIAALLTCLHVARCPAQPAYVLDPNYFKPTFRDWSIGTTYSPGPSDVHVAMQADGKLIVAGSGRHGLARLNSDGSLDPSFNPADFVLGWSDISAVVVLADQKILFGGPIDSTCRPLCRWEWSRFHPDGQLDRSFMNVPGGSPIERVLPLLDGQIVDGGAQAAALRVGAGGSLDASFNPMVRGTPLAFQAGKLLITGAVKVGTEVSLGWLTRLNVDGTVDSSFHPPSPEATNIYPLRVLSDGKILISGELGQIPDLPAVGGLARLKPNGDFDKLISTNWTPWSQILAETADAKLVALLPPPQAAAEPAGHQWTRQLIGSFEFSLVRMRADGEIEAQGVSLRGGFAQVLGIQPDGGIVVRYTVPKAQVAGYSDVRFIRFTPDLVIDPAFDLHYSAATPWNFDRLTRQADGKLLAESYSDPEGTVRLNKDGSLDESFVPAPNSLFILGVQPDSKLLARAPANDLLRLNSDGTRDTNFTAIPSDTGTQVRTTLRAVFPRADGSTFAVFSTTVATNRILGGTVVAANKEVSVNLTVIPPEGGSGRSLSGDLAVDVPINERQLEVVFQSDGKVVLVGSLTRIGDLPCDGVARINANGAIDPAFNARLGFGSGGYFEVIVDRNDRIVIERTKSSFGLFEQQLLRLLPGGEIDESFKPAMNDLPSFHLLAVGDDGSVYGRACGGSCYGIVRIRPDGTVSTIAAAIRASDITSLVIEPDGSLVADVPGDFPNFAIVDGHARYGLARFQAAPVWRSSSFDTSGRFTGTIGCLPGWRYRVEASADLKQWDTVATGTSANESVAFTDIASTNPARRFYRVVKE